MKVALCYRVLQHWRTPVFRRLAATPGIVFRAYYGADYPGTKTVSGKNLSGFESRRLFTIPLKRHYLGEGVGLPLCPTLPFHLLAFRPDVILVEGGSNLINNVLVYLYAALTRTPVVWWTLGDLRPVENPSLPLRLWRGLLRFLEGRSTAWLGYSSLAIRYFDRMGYPKPAQFRAVNCVDTDGVLARLDAARGRVPALREELKLGSSRVLLFVGAINPVKRIEDLIHVYARLKPKYPDLRLVIVGDGIHRPVLERLVAELKLDGVKFTGEVVDGVSSYFLLGNVFVLPGLGGLGISEAMAHSLPIIATEADGCEVDLVEDGKNGYILPVGDLDKLETALDGMLADPDGLRAMGEHSRWIIDHKHNINTYMANVVAALRYAASRGKIQADPAPSPVLDVFPRATAQDLAAT